MKGLRSLLLVPLLVLGGAATLTGCMTKDDEDKGMPPAVDATLISDMNALGGLRILFAHQSVGGNILEGVAALKARANSTVPIRQSRALGENSTGINHFLVGENEKPELKIADYVRAVDESPVKPDIAMLKLCYIDFDQNTDPERLADRYISELDALQARHPGTRVVAVTAPLTIVQTGPKAWIKRALGRPLGGYALNAKRSTFNARIREHFSGDRLFDLAAAENPARPGAEAPKYEGRPIEAMDPGFTHDGGHLNETGQAWVARKFVHFLATQAR